MGSSQAPQCERGLKRPMNYFAFVVCGAAHRNEWAALCMWCNAACECNQTEEKAAIFPSKEF